MAVPLVGPSNSGVVVVAGLASDSHTWNLVYLQLLIEELGHPVVNLGPCVPDELMLAECLRIQPAMLVLSSVNGHGHADGRRVITRLRACAELSSTPVVIGGKLGVHPELAEEHARELRAAGFDAVFADGSVDAFQSFVAVLSESFTIGEESVTEVPAPQPLGTSRGPA
jgi:methylaspartate mutase sigma subunit